MNRFKTAVARMFAIPKNLVKRLPPINRLIDERDRALQVLRNAGAFAPGHYYSPFPDQDELRLDEQRVFGAVSPEIPDIDLNAAEQLELLEAISGFYEEIPFRPERIEGLRYCFENRMYSYADAIFLYGMLRHLRPQRIVEIGSGFSSAVILDTNELFLGRTARCTFIDPDTTRLESLFKAEDRSHVAVVRGRLQDVDAALFQELAEGDILFVDSSHVTKTGSDVNRIIFEILPLLSTGVYIHFHDIFYPFEYPKEWVYSGRAWNEAYLLRAFLQCNARFRIRIWNHYLSVRHSEELMRRMPLCFNNTGASLWIEKVR